MLHFFRNAARACRVSAALAVCIVAGFSGLAGAGIVDSEIVYNRKAWQVRIVAFDDGTFACSAEVGTGNSNFLIWADATNNASLQFYNKSWSFDGGTADVELRIDRRASWTLNDAKLDQSSVFFTLVDEESSYRFLREVMAGNHLSLYSSSGSRIERYSLAGSHASILALSKCVDVLKADDGDGNPFN